MRQFYKLQLLRVLKQDKLLMQSFTKTDILLFSGLFRLEIYRLGRHLLEVDYFLVHLFQSKLLELVVQKVSFRKQGFCRIVCFVLLTKTRLVEAV